MFLFCCRVNSLLCSGTSSVQNENFKMSNLWFITAWVRVNNSSQTTARLPHISHYFRVWHHARVVNTEGSNSPGTNCENVSVSRRIKITCALGRSNFWGPLKTAWCLSLFTTHAQLEIRIRLPACGELWVLKRNEACVFISYIFSLLYCDRKYMFDHKTRLTRQCSVLLFKRGLFLSAWRIMLRICSDVPPSWNHGLSPKDTCMALNCTNRFSLSKISPAKRWRNFGVGTGPVYLMEASSFTVTHQQRQWAMLSFQISRKCSVYQGGKLFFFLWKA